MVEEKPRPVMIALSDGQSINWKPVVKKSWWQRQWEKIEQVVWFLAGLVAGLLLGGLY